MKKISRSHHSSLNELNITPLLDLAFVLLVIFIITTPQMSNDLEMNLPSPKKENNPAPPPKLNRIVVNSAGQVSVNDKVVLVKDLKAHFLSMKAADKDLAVVVRGASDVDYQNIIGVLDALQQADISKVGLATETQ